jgi:hypothetical protein
MRRRFTLPVAGPNGVAGRVHTVDKKLFNAVLRRRKAKATTLRQQHDVFSQSIRRAFAVFSPIH